MSSGFNRCPVANFALRSAIVDPCADIFACPSMNDSRCFSLICSIAPIISGCFSLSANSASMATVDFPVACETSYIVFANFLLASAASLCAA